MCVLIIEQMLVSLIDLGGPLGHFQNGAALRHLLQVVVFSINCVKIMLACWIQFLLRFAAFGRLVWFLGVAVPISGGPIKFVTRWEVVLLCLTFFMWITFFFRVTWFVSWFAFKWLITRIVYFIFILYGFFGDIFPRELFLILWLAIKWDIFVLAFHSRH